MKNSEDTRPLVSIVMPAYNSEKFIHVAIESVINQTYTNWELLVVNDNSTDSTKIIVEELSIKDSRIKLINRNVNSGKPSGAKNSALDFVRGEYIAFLDSDDMWIDKKLELQISFMIKNKNYVLTYTGGYWINSAGHVIKRFLPKYSDGDNLKNMLGRYEINNQSVVVRTNIFKDVVNKFNETITIGEDYNAFMHILAKYKIASIKQYLIKYRIHNSGITKSSKRVSDGVLVTLKELDRLYGIKKSYFMRYFFSFIKAVRFKFVSKKWK